MAADVAEVVEQVAALRTEVSSIAPQGARESKETLGDLVCENSADGSQEGSNYVRASGGSSLLAESRPANTSSGSGAGAAARMDPAFSRRNSLGRSNVREDGVSHRPGLTSEGGGRPDRDNRSSRASGAAAMKQCIEPSARERIPAREGPSNRKGLHSDGSGAQQTPSSLTMANGVAAPAHKADGVDGRGDNASTQPSQNLNEEVNSKEMGQRRGLGVGFAPAWHAGVMEEDDDTYADLMTSPRTDRSLYEV